MKKSLNALLLALALALLALVGQVSFAQDKPAEIRLGISMAGVGGKPKIGGSVIANIHLRGLLEEEFAKDGIKIVWYFFPGAGPATNEAFSNKKVDFGFHGDLPLIVGRSTGLRHKIIFSSGRGGPSYFVVPAASQAKTLADLKGKTLSNFKGTSLQLSLARLLRLNGLTEKDFRIISQDTYAARTSLSTGDIDGTITSPWALESRGVAKRLIEIRGDKGADGKYGIKPTIDSPGTVWVGEEFEQKYPHIVQRLVNVFIKAAAWSSEEENRETQFKLWAQSGNAYIDYKNDWEGYDLKLRHDPLLDEYYIARIKQAVAEALEFGLIRNDVSVDDWLEPKYLNNALKELGLENYWTPLDKDGKPVR
ncbi:MAG: ABC transporter substrate-binding protein [Azoarcus sp.]|jgi:sulfonate transport system substrate-binding protein|nr:ABC transporter substrate-binding protein [Azoarcus sp.]